MLFRSLYDEKLMDEYIKVVKEKLDISDSEFEQIMNAPVHYHWEFKSDKDEWFYKIRHMWRK